MGNSETRRETTYGDWETCQNGKTSRTNTIKTFGRFGQQINSEQIRERDRPCASNCVPDAWQTVDCGTYGPTGAKQSRRLISREKSPDGKILPCKTSEEYRFVPCKKETVKTSEWGPCVNGQTSRENTYIKNVEGLPFGKQVTEQENSSCAEIPVSQWTVWSDCSNGISTRQRNVVIASGLPNPNGEMPRVLRETVEIQNRTCGPETCMPTLWYADSCNPTTNTTKIHRVFKSKDGIPCNPPSEEFMNIPCKENEWSSWEPCQNGETLRRREFLKIIVPGKGQDQAQIEHQIDRRPCATDTCIPTVWLAGECDPVNLTRIETRSFIDPNGIPCKINSETRVVPCGQPNVLSDWSEWGNCKQKRTRPVTKMVNGESVTTIEIEERDCNA